MPRYAAPDPCPAPSGRRVPSLETDYPRVLQAIQAMWGYPELNEYFRKLTIDDRGGREGFPPEVWDEIHTLLYLHQLIVPEPLFR
jgi:hypothetical protein